jgi:hypothetical protein
MKATGSHITLRVLGCLVESLFDRALKRGLPANGRQYQRAASSLSRRIGVSQPEPTSRAQINSSVDSLANPLR